MTESNTDDATLLASSKKRKKFNHIWWLPLIALLMVSYLAINHFTSMGPLVTIDFNSAEGLEVNKTKVKYKDVIIGKVENIHLSDDLKGVTVSVRMDKSSEDLLRENTRFWIVKPRVGITKISGLNTLLSGNYIAIEPDKLENSNYRYDFIGLENPPIISQDEPGLRITLLSSKASSLYPGTAIYYKGMQVGTVNRVYFSDDYLWVKADVFIASPHDKLIKSTTKFWSTSGISLGAGPEGIEVSMESVETLISGGITFETPVDLSADDSASGVENGTEYLLFANQKAAAAQNTGRKRYFVTYFDGSIKGLEVGSPVTIQGMTVGKVKDVRLLFDADQVSAKIPILFEIYEDSFTLINAASQTTASPGDDDKELKTLMTHLLKDGLKTRLETGNLLTGSKNIALVLNATPTDIDTTLREDPVTGYDLIPSTEQGYAAITAGVTDMVNKINNLPLEDIAKNFNALLNNANGKVDALALDQTLARLNNLLKSADKAAKQLELAGGTLTKTAKSTLKSLDRSLNDLAKTAESTLAGYSADAPLYHNLNLTLTQLNDTLSALKTVMDMLDRHPNALVFGEDKPASPKQSYWEQNEK